MLRIPLPLPAMIPIEKGGAKQFAAFAPATEAVIGFTHRNDRHMAIMPEAVRAELTTGFG
jgi:hypothetical protein